MTDVNIEMPVETATPAAAPLRWLVLINRQSGTVRSSGAEAVRGMVAEGLTGAGRVEIRLVAGKDIVPEAKRAVAAAAHDVIVVGGGDGSLSSVAGLLVGTGITMGVLPLGTMNMVAKAAGLDMALPRALEQLASGVAVAVDVGRVNGAVFLHQVSFGLQPRVVRVRERIGYNSRLTKMLSGVVALTAVLSRPRPVKAIASVDGRYTRLRAPALAISNNVYASDNPAIPARLDGGQLGLYAFRATRWTEYARLALATLRSRWKEDAAVDVASATRIRLVPFRKRQRAKMLASVDGELRYFKAPVTLTIEPGALRLLLPVKQEGTMTGQTT